MADTPGIEVVGEGSDGADAIRKTEELQPALVLLDIELPVMNGFIAAQRIKEISPDTKILFLSMHSSAEVLREALVIGAGLVSKTDAAHHLLPIIWAVVRGEPIDRFKILGDPANPSHR